MTDDLIARLSTDLTPARRSGVTGLLLLALAAGSVVAAVIMVPWLGLRADLATAWQDPIFWTKFGYTLLLAAAGLWAVERLARPGASAKWPLLAVVVIFLVCGTLGIVQFATAAPEDVRHLVLGGTALVCPFYIIALSLPILVGTIVAMRRLAPTNLVLAGLAAGLLAGGAGAWVYAFHCGENGLPFLAIWYTTGVTVVGLIGAATGRWLLRW